MLFRFMYCIIVVIHVKKLVMYRSHQKMQIG
jgi:hypothetical protein